MLAAERVSYEPLHRADDTARRRVTVTDATGASTTYDWRLEKQTAGPFDGCWMTVGVVEVD